MDGWIELNALLAAANKCWLVGPIAQQLCSILAKINSVGGQRAAALFLPSRCACPSSSDVTKKLWMVIVAKVIIDNISIELWWSTKLWCERVKMCVYISFFIPVRTQVDWGRPDKKTICQHCWWEVPKWWKLQTIFWAIQNSHTCACVIQKYGFKFKWWNESDEMSSCCAACL